MMTDKESQLKAKLLKLKLAGKLTDYQKRDFADKLKDPLAKKVPFGKDDRGPGKIRDDALDKSEASTSGKKVRPKTPTDADRARIITAKAKVNKLKKKSSIPDEIMQEAADAAGQNKNLAPSYIAQDHKHSIIFKGHRLGGFKGASLNSQSGKFAKYWLLNAKETNGNGWGIAAHTAKENMKKFIGRPLVVTAKSWHGASEYGEEYEHPYLPTNDISAILNHQDKFRVGSIVDVFEDNNGDWFANIEMLPKFASRTLPPFCSPAIYQLDAKENEGQISKWEALHLAALNENPAYGARIALLKGTCIGTGNECQVQFKSAKLEGKVICTKKLKGRVANLKKKQKIAYKGGSKYDRQITDLSKNFETQRDEITKRRPDSTVGKQPPNTFGNTCTNEATCGATSGFLKNKLLIDHGLNYKQVKIEGGMYTGPGGEFSSAGMDDNGTPTVGHEWVRLDDGTILDGSSGQFMNQKNKINQKQRLRVIPPNAPLQKYYKGHYSHNPMGRKVWYDNNDPLKKEFAKIERKIRRGKLKGRVGKIKQKIALDLTENVKHHMKGFMGRPEKQKTRLEKELFGDMLATNSKSKMQLLTNLESIRDDKILERDDEGDIINSLGDTRGTALVHSFSKDNPHGIVSPIDKQEQEYQQTKQLMKKPVDGPNTQMTQERATRTLDDIEKGNARKSNRPVSSTYKFKISKLKARLAGIDYSEFYKKERRYEKENPLPTERQPKGFGEIMGLVDPPALTKEVPFGKDKRSRFRRNLDTPDYAVTKTNVFKTDGDKITPPEGLNMKSPFKPRRDKTTGLPSRKSPRQSDRVRIIKAKLATLGEQNMTYQDSKKVKIIKKKHPEVRKASLASEFAHNDIEGVLRKIHSSPLPPDKREHQSSFLSSTGDYIGGGEDHTETIKSIFKDKEFTPEDKGNDGPVTRFSIEHKLPRVQRRMTRRGGRVSFGIHSPINKTQLRSIQDVEKAGEELAFVVGPDVNGTVGEGYRDLTKALRENKFL